MEVKNMGKKRTNNEVKDILRSFGYIQIGQYNGAREPIKCLDADGYIVYPVLYRLYDGKAPLRFHKSNPATIENINHYIAINHINTKLRSSEFIDATSKLWFECACGDLYQTSWSNFVSKNKHCCNNCSSYGGNYVPFKKIVRLLSDKNLKPLFSEDEYIGMRNTKLPISNLIGYKAPFLSEYCYRADIEPGWFHVSNPYTIENINLYLFNETDGEYECISSVYTGNKDPLTILHHKCNRTFEAKWINLYRKPSEKEPNRHGTRCPYCTGLRSQSLHAVVLKQLFLKLKDSTVIEDRSCINPLTNCIMPTDIVNHKEKIVVEIQSWFHDFDDRKEKDKIKKDFWESRGYIVYTPDIRDYTVLEMAQIFFPDLKGIPDWIRYDFENKLNVDVAQELLDNGLLVTDVALEMGVSPHRIYDAIYSKRLRYPDNYKNKNLIQTKYINQQVTVQTAG